MPNHVLQSRRVTIQKITGKGLGSPASGRARLCRGRTVTIASETSVRQTRIIQVEARVALDKGHGHAYHCRL